jgi:hypothetical protein
MAYTGAFGFATGLLFSVGMVIPFLTMINGTCLIYLQVTDGLNFTSGSTIAGADAGGKTSCQRSQRPRRGKIAGSKDRRSWRLQRRPRIISQRRKPKQISPQQ